MRDINKTTIQYAFIGVSAGAVVAILLAMYFISVNKPTDEQGKNGTSVASGRTTPLKTAFFTLTVDEQAEQIISNHLASGKDDNNYIVQSLRTLVNTTSWFEAFPDEKKIILIQSLDNITSAIKIGQRYNSTDPIIVYDIEHWPRTPVDERSNPVQSISEGADRVHKAGFKYGVAPDADFLLKRYKEISWNKIDFVDMQLQRYSKDPEKFGAYAEQIGAYVKSQNSRIELFAQISLGRTDYHESTNALQRIGDTIDGVFIAYIPESGLASHKYASQQIAERTLEQVLDDIDKIKGNRPTD